MIEDVLYINGKLDLLSGEEINRCLMSRTVQMKHTFHPGAQNKRGSDLLELLWCPPPEGNTGR